MKKVLIIGSGAAGMSCAIRAAENGLQVILAAAQPPERSQSVMAAGGINAVLPDCAPGDSIDCHIADTLRAAGGIAGRAAVSALCADAPEIVAWLERLGTVFNRETDGTLSRRPFGGQSYQRTVYAGASTGKQVVSALAQELCRLECAGAVEWRENLLFHSGLVRDGVCCGALFYDLTSASIVPIYADAVVVATGGQNQLFGKTSGSVCCDGYAAGRLFLQGVPLKNLEFIQYHPTTVETAQKRMLITEGARGEGGRLFYEDGGRRVYFMEEKFGERGNLMPRDVVSKCIYDAPAQVYLDISYLGKKEILKKLPEVYNLCRDYLGLDVTAAPIPVAPAIHFFMGGIAVDLRHRTGVQRLYAIGECASLYHGANRLGGNSLLAALHGGRAAADDIAADTSAAPCPDFSGEIAAASARLNESLRTKSPYSAVSVMQKLTAVMAGAMGITRTGEKLADAVAAVEALQAQTAGLPYDCEMSPYFGYRLEAMLALGKACLRCAEARQESRGAHIRDDYPARSDAFAKSTIIRFNGGDCTISYAEEDQPCL